MSDGPDNKVQAEPDDAEETQAEQTAWEPLPDADDPKPQAEAVEPPDAPEEAPKDDLEGDPEALLKLAGRKEITVTLGPDNREFTFRTPSLYQMAMYDKRFGGLDAALSNLTATTMGDLVWVLGTREDGFDVEFPDPETFQKFVDLVDVPNIAQVCREVFGLGGDEETVEEEDPADGEPFSEEALQPDTG